MTISPIGNDAPRSTYHQAPFVGPHVAPQVCRLPSLISAAVPQQPFIRLNSDGFLFARFCPLPDCGGGLGEGGGGLGEGGGGEGDGGGGLGDGEGGGIRGGGGNNAAWTATSASSKVRALRALCSYTRMGG